MLARGLKLMVLVGLCAGMSACGQRGDRSSLINLRQSAIAPDEFLVVPQKPLETPSDLRSLPAPVPGEKPLVEIDFEASLFAALGGGQTSGSSVPASDRSFVAAAQAQFGVTRDIRDVLRAEDQAYRDRYSGRLERLAKKREAARLYDPMLLDPLAELARLRALGVSVPAVPPL